MPRRSKTPKGVKTFRGWLGSPTFFYQKGYQGSFIIEEVAWPLNVEAYVTLDLTHEPAKLLSFIPVKD